MTNPTQFKIGDQVLVTPKCGPMGGHEFMAQIEGSRHPGQYTVKDQDDDFFDVDADELQPLPEE